MDQNISDIETYIQNFPAETQHLLREMRELIRILVPEAGEKISYAIPTFTLSVNLVHYAGYAHHIGFYPGAAGISHFAKKLST